LLVFLQGLNYIIDVSLVGRILDARVLTPV
jgi:hypothetical protein